MMNVIDQTGRSVSIPVFPQRIISLVPSQTELLFDLGLEDRIVGITRFCIHPSSWKKTKAIIGGTKQFDFKVIEGLRPDLILGNKEENYKDGIEVLASKYPVWISDVFDLQDALTMIEQIGSMTGSDMRSRSLVKEIESAFQSVQRKKPARILYLIWRKPWMAVGSNTFVHSMIESIGWKNCMEELLRYPEISAEEIARLDPDIVLLSSEPFPFREKHIEELRGICPRAKIALVDGEMFSWYGSRLRLAPRYFNSLDL